MTTSAPNDSDNRVAQPLHERRWFRLVVLVVILAVCGWIIWKFIGSIDWAAVWDALGRLSWWQFLPLFAMLMVRQFCNALPLSFFIRGLSPARALINDLAAAMMAMIAPPPSDMVMRVTMFKSWDIEASRGLAGATMNTVSFYVNRFAAPIIGLALATVFEIQTDHGWAALAGGTVALTLALITYGVVRTDGFATSFGLLAGRTAQRFRSSVDPGSWGEATNQFREHIAETYRYGFPRALAVLAVMVLADSLILLMTLRFVGVSATDLPTLYVVAVFFLAYPLTLFPLMGLGVLDTVLLAAFVGVGGEALEAEIVAAFAVWRVVTLITPAVLGMGASAWWRREQAGK